MSNFASDVLKHSDGIRFCFSVHPGACIISLVANLNTAIVTILCKETARIHGKYREREKKARFYALL